MRRICVALAFGIVAVVVSTASPALAQSTKTATGTVTAMAADSLTVKVADHDMKFTVDSTTHVEAAGAGTKTRAAQRAGQPGPKLADVVKVGQNVNVTYSEAGGAMRATRIRARSAAKAASTTTADTSAKTSSGTVDSISPTSMTISGSSGSGAKFTQSFMIDAETKVVGRGAGTAAAAKGGKTVVTDLVANGDRVSVSYHPAGTALHAAEIRVTMKKAGSPK